MEARLPFKTRKEIARELNISYKSLLRFIKHENIDLPKRKLLSPLHYQRIYNHFSNNSDQEE